ncbi:MAG TPA: hypothetical protein VJJ70_08775, partial [Anaerolineales bacterium]|nr:hypothetical protein [Anaerolineales bacterium]
MVQRVIQIEEQGGDAICGRGHGPDGSLEDWPSIRHAASAPGDRRSLVKSMPLWHTSPVDVM